jgi:leader peptidase (prepilin peptidase) / N-methyltransferase
LQYPLVEALLGVLYVVVLLVHGLDPLRATFFDWMQVFLDALVWTVLLAIVVYDLKHKIIPDSFSLTFALLSGTILLLEMTTGTLGNSPVAFLSSGSFPWWADIVAGPLLALPFALLWYFSKGRAMGLGDAKLAWGLGWFLGLAGGFTAVVFSFWIAFFPSLFLLLVPGKKFGMKSEIPFAPFLVLGTLAIYITGLNLLSWTL